MLFKILHGDASRISTDITPFHEGYCYVTYDGSMYVDMNLGTETAPNNKRVQLNAKDALTSIEAQALINQNNGEKVQLWVGTQAELDAIEERDENCVYFTTDEIDFDPNDVLLVTEQELTEEQKAQARANIGAISIDHRFNFGNKALQVSGFELNSCWQGQLDSSTICYHVSDMVPTITTEMISDGIVIEHICSSLNTQKSNLQWFRINQDDISIGSDGFTIFFNDGIALAFIVPEDNYTSGNTTLPFKGVYFAMRLGDDDVLSTVGIEISGFDFHSSVNNNSNLPSDFLTSGASSTVTWDGNTDGLESVYDETNDMYYYKIPQVKHSVTLEDFSQGVTAVMHMEINGTDNDTVSDDEVLVDSSKITIEQHLVLGEVYNLDYCAYLSKTGDVYFPYMYETYGEAVAMAYCSSLTVNGCSDAFQTAVINKDYLPSHTHTMNDLPITFSTVDLEDGVSTLPAGTIQLVYEE